jgi:glycerol-3-phosphate acyltransferase PlsY
MPDTAAVLLALLAAYALGTFPTAQLVGRRRGLDPTVEGSGNPGASNVYRTAGRRAGVVVLVGDLVKGLAATGAGLLAGGRLLGLALGAAAVVGHVFPVTRRFRGGKGVATAAGMAAVAFPLTSVILVAVWLAVAKLTRTASMASLVIAVALPAAVALQGRPATETAVVAGVALLVVVRHAANLRRLLDRSEARIG